MLLTYITYNFILFGSVYFGYLYEKSNVGTFKSKFYLALTFIIPFFFLAIRYDIGTDYQSYVTYFRWITEQGNDSKELGYTFLNHSIAFFNLDIQWLFVFFGFFTILYFYKALPKDGFALGIFLFVTIFYLYEGYSAIRQGLAIAIMAYAAKYILSKKPSVYFLYGVIAFMFHSVTAVVLLLSYFYANRKINKFVQIAVLVIVFGLVSWTNLPQKVLTLLITLTPKYSWYLESQFIQEAKTSFGLLGPLIKTGIVISVLLFKEKIINKYPIANIHLNLLFLYEVFYLFKLDIQIFGRLEHVFIFSLIISLVFFMKTVQKQSRVIAIVIILVFYYFLFIRYIANGTIDKDNSVYISPYQTIFSR